MEQIEKILVEIHRLKKELDGYTASEGLDYIESYINLIRRESSLPSDSDEAAKEFAKTTFKKPYSDNPDEEVTIVEPDKYAGFIAGVEWMAEYLKK